MKTLPELTHGACLSFLSCSDANHSRSIENKVMLYCQTANLARRQAGRLGKELLRNTVAYAGIRQWNAGVEARYSIE